MRKAAVVIVTHNAEKYIKPLFESLTRLSGDFKIFVVDNNSRDGTVAAIRRLTIKEVKSAEHGEEIEKQETRNKKQGCKEDTNFNPPAGGQISNDDCNTPCDRQPDVEMIESGENLGFAAGNNVGMRRVLEEGWEYIVLLNQDMAVEEDWLLELVRKAESDDRIGVVQAMMILAKNRSKINSTGERLNFLGIGYSGNFQLPISNFQLTDNIITYASGAAVLYKREVLEKVGLFDESFFMYHEDSDLSWRARLAGWDIALAEKAICYHDYRFNSNPKTFYWTEKNRLAFLLKNFELKTLFLIFPMFGVMEFGMLGYALATGWFWYKIKSYGWVLRNLGRIFESRREIQKTRKVRDRELKQYLVAGIEFSGFENWVLKYIANPVMKLYWRIIGWLI